MPDTLMVSCTRTFDAPVDRVFRAFTVPDLMRRWWSPDSAVAVEVLTWDLEPGGRWRFAYRFPEGDVIHVGGTFSDIVPSRRLSFTWTWEPPDTHAGIQTLVSVTFDGAPDGARTTVRVLHERFPDEETRDRHDAGWSSTLDRLQEIVA